MIASYREKVDVVRYLLSVGAEINRTSVKGLNFTMGKSSGLIPFKFKVTLFYTTRLKLGIWKSLKCLLMLAQKCSLMSKSFLP
jgi:hypothetical protein